MLKNPPLRILLISGSFPPMKCGVGDYTRRLAESLGEQPDVAVGVLSREEAGALQGPRRYELYPVVKSWRMGDLPRVVRTIRHFRPDIVHIQHPGQGYVGHLLPTLIPLISRAAGAHAVQTWHEYYPKIGIVQTLNAMATDKIIVVRPDFVEKLPASSRGLIPRREFRFIRNGSSIPAVRLTAPERESIARKYAPAGRNLVVHFGFVAPHKGTDRIFDIADPETDHLVIASDLSADDPFQASVRTRSGSPPWSGKTTITGFLPEEELARLLAAADAVVFPYRTGGGLWNTSIHGATVQGTFVLATSTDRSGYDPARNICFTEPDNLEEMRAALKSRKGTRLEVPGETDDWKSISEEHIRVYRRALGAS